MKRKLQGYVKRARHEYSMWRWRRQSQKNTLRIQQWKQSFQASSAEVILGAHLVLLGGVRNHLLAIKRFSGLNVELVPTEEQLQKWGIQPFYASEQHVQQFVETPPPSTAFAVHTHVFPQLINWAKLHAPGKLRWVHTHHAFYYPNTGTPQIESWEQNLNDSMILAAQSADVCLCVNRWEQKTLVEQHGVNAVFVPNGVDLPRSDNADPERFRRKYRIDSPFALWVGYLEPVKNPLSFITLAQRQPETQFVMIGGQSEAVITKLYGVTPPRNLRLLPNLTHEQTLDAIAACSTLVVTSHKEGMPTLVLEGMALRRPIVIPRERGCMDATDGESCAAVYEPDKELDIDEKVLRSMAEQIPNEVGRQRTLSVFDWRVVAAELDQIYQGKTPAANYEAAR